MVANFWVNVWIACPYPYGWINERLDKWSILKIMVAPLGVPFLYLLMWHCLFPTFVTVVVRRTVKSKPWNVLYMLYMHILPVTSFLLVLLPVWERERDGPYPFSWLVYCFSILSTKKWDFILRVFLIKPTWITNKVALWLFISNWNYGWHEIWHVKGQ